MKKGFTLIEILIVIAVIAILIGIALPRMKGMQDEGNITKAKGELRAMQVAIESFYTHNSNAYPAALANLTSASPNIIGTTLPTDPFSSGNNYGYNLSSNSKYYVAYSVGVGGNGSASIADTGNVTETNGAQCIYISNGAKDVQP